jgi:hypothetical protein
MFEQSEEVKQYFKASADRRKERALRLGRWEIRIDPHAIIACHEFWTSWVAAFGKELATDYLVEALTEEHFLLLDRLEYKKTGKLKKGKRRRAKNKVSGHQALSRKPGTRKAV